MKESRHLHFTWLDIGKFLVLSSIFSIVLFSYQSAYSPYVETTFDSASIENAEQKALQLTTPVQPNEETQPKTAQVQTTQVEEKKPEDTLILSFRPETIKIDDGILDLVRTNVDSKYFSPKVAPLRLVFDAERKEPRGQVSGNRLILSGKITSESENLKVFVHELGHVVDIFYLKQKENGDDLSSKFYSISWDSYNIKKDDAIIADFVSGYALSNKYEDFAESFAFYVFHNSEFARRAQKNAIMKEKYDFFHSYVFEDDAFVGTGFETKTLKSYNWDTTRIDVNVKKYLFYIR